MGERGGGTELKLYGGVIFITTLHFFISLEIVKHPEK